MKSIRFLIGYLGYLLIFNFTTYCAEEINSPGLYVFGGDIIDTSSMVDGSLLTINASYVTVDLNGHTIAQNTINTSTNVIGIKIAAGVEDVTILNGTVGPISGIGLLIEGNSSEILINKLKIHECTRAGIYSEGTASTPVDSLTIKNSDISSCGGAILPRAAGLEATYTNAILATDTYFSRNINTLGDTYGIYLNNSQTSEFIACRINSNTGVETAAGIYLITCTNIRISESTLTQNIATGTISPNAYGIYLSDGTSALIEETLTGAQIALSGSAYGIYITGSEGVGIKDCITAEQIGGAYASGLSYINGSQLIVINTNSEGNRCFAGPAYGIHLSGATLCSIRDNTVLNNLGAASFGIFDEESASSNVYLGNYVFNSGTNYTVTYGGGVILPIISGSLSSAIPGLPSNTGGVLANISITP